MSLDRAESDLAKARAEMIRLRTALEAASAKVIKLEHYIEVTRAYEAENTEETMIGRSAGAALALASAQIIRERGERQKTIALVEELERRGHHIGGKNKVTNLSGALSRSSDLTSNRTEGWGLAEWGSSGGPQEELTAANEAFNAAMRRPSSAPQQRKIQGIEREERAAWEEPLPALEPPSWEPPSGDLDEEIPF